MSLRPLDELKSRLKAEIEKAYKEKMERLEREFTKRADELRAEYSKVKEEFARKLKI